MIRFVRLNDAPSLAGIYNHFILNTVVTFEEEPVSFSGMRERIRVNSARFPWIVYEQSGTILGYAYASEWKSRCAYKYTVETTIYLKPGAQGQGLGTELYTRLIELIREKRLHSAIGGIALPNAGSIALHEKLGFENIGLFKEVGYKFDAWVDVGYWELLLE